jgi:hypothetical protein
MQPTFQTPLIYIGPDILRKFPSFEGIDRLRHPEKAIKFRFYTRNFSDDCRVNNTAALAALNYISGVTVYVNYNTDKINCGTVIYQQIQQQ